MNILNKKYILLALVLLVVFVLLIILLSSLFKKESAKDFSGSYKKIATDNKLAKDSDFKKEVTEKDSQENINKSLLLIKDAIISRADIIGLDKENINKNFDEASKEISDQKYKKSLEKTKRNIDEINSAVENYKKSQEKEMEAIKAVVVNEKYEVIVANQKIVGDWAKVTLTAPGGYDFAQGRFLKKENGKWKEISASFDKKKILTENLKDLGAPTEIIDSLKEFHTEDILTPIKY